MILLVLLLFVNFQLWIWSIVHVMIFCKMKYFIKIMWLFLFLIIIISFFPSHRPLIDRSEIVTNCKKWNLTKPKRWTESGGPCSVVFLITHQNRDLVRNPPEPARWTTLDEGTLLFLPGVGSFSSYHSQSFPKNSTENASKEISCNEPHVFNFADSSHGLLEASSTANLE